MLTLEAARLGPALVAALLAAWLWRLWCDPGRGLRPWVGPALWLGAAVVLALNAAAFVLNDDEVFYLADSHAQWKGETSGYLPLRYLLLRPLVALPLSPSRTVILARVAMVLVAAACGVAAARVARVMGATPAVAVAAGAVATLWLGTAVQVVFLRPEYLAAACFSTALVLLVAPPTRLSPRAAIAVAFALLALAGGISPRVGLLIPFAWAALIRDRHGLSVRSAMVWSLAGLLLGAAPTVVYVLAFDDPAALWYWNVVVPREYGPLSSEPSAKFPLALFAAGVAGLLAIGLPERGNRPGGEATIALLWAGSTLLPLVVPHWLAYAHGPWVVLSVVLGAIFWTRAAARASVLGWSAAVALLAFCATGAFLHPAGLRWSVDSGFRSQLGLIDWLAEASRGGRVACVSPYHPIRAANAWRVWNAWWYCYRRDLSGMGGLAVPWDGPAAVIEWDAWPQRSGQANVIAWALARGLLPRTEADEVVRRLARDYRLVKWRQPLPGPYGGGTFLLHRALQPDGRVEVLDDSHISRAAP